jgi:hypothetical protein
MTAYDHQAITEHLMDGYEEQDDGSILFEVNFSVRAMDNPDWQRRFVGWLHTQADIDGVEQMDENVTFVVPVEAQWDTQQSMLTWQRHGFIDGWQEL